MDKLSSLLRKSVNYSREKFYTIGPWGQFYKTFLSVIYEFSEKARVFIPGKLFKPSLTYTLSFYENS